MPNLKELQNSKNIAELLNDEQLTEIGCKVVHNFDIDEASRSEWEDRVDEAMKLARQTMERKTHPFPGASNIKYPLITRASIDFAARTYPEIIQKERAVNIGVIGRDPAGLKFRRANRITKHMSYQLLQQDDHWEDDTDKLLHILPGS